MPFPELQSVAFAHRLGTRRVLLVVAAPLESTAIRLGLGLADSPVQADPALGWVSKAVHPLIDLVESGIGKANAAAAAAQVCDPARHALVVSAGIAGTYAVPGVKGSSGSIGRMVLGTASVFADEGVATPTEFRPVHSIGFPMIPGMPTSSMPVDPAWFNAAKPTVDDIGLIATVSTCSGTDALAESARTRTGAVAEAMEGAAVGLVAARRSIPFLEVRAISNTTGDRDRQVWDVRAATARLARWMGDFARVLESLR